MLWYAPVPKEPRFVGKQYLPIPKVLANAVVREICSLRLTRLLNSDSVELNQ